MAKRLQIFNCNIPRDIADKDILWEHDPGYRNDVQKSVDRIYRLLDNTQPITKNADQARIEQARNLVETRMNYATQLSAGNKLNPGTVVRGWRNWLAREFGIWRNWGGISDGFDELGATYHNMATARRKWRAGAADALARVEAAQTIDSAWQAVLPIKKKYQLSDAEFFELTTLAEELGWQPFLKDYKGLTERGAKYMQAQQRAFLERASELGLSSVDLQTLIQNARSVAEVYHEVLNIFQRSGVEVSELDVLGYLPRAVSVDTRKKLHWAKIRQQNRTFAGAEEFALSNGERIDIFQAFTKSRDTYDYIVEDEIFLDYLIRRIDPDIYRRLGVDGLPDLYDDSFKMGKLLFDELTEQGAKPTRLDRLIQLGIFSKIPQNSMDVYDHVKRGLRLPYEGLNDMFAVDWRAGYRQYTSTMESIAGDAGMAWQLSRNVIEGNWGIPAVEYSADPSKYKGFVRFSDAIPERLMTRFGLDRAALNGSQFETLHNTFVHPVVADVYRSFMELSIDPNKLSAIGHALNYLGNHNKTFWLMTSRYMGRQLVNQYAVLMASGGDMMTFTKDLAKFQTAILRRKPIDALLDDTAAKTFAGGMSEKRLYSEARRLGFLNDFVPGFIGESTKTAYHPRWRPTEVKRVARQMWHTWSEYKNLGKVAVDLADAWKFGALDRLGHPFRWWNNHVENVAKFSALKTLTRDGGGAGEVFSRISGSFSTGGLRRFDNTEDAINHLEKYFYWYDDAGKSERMLGNILPFWGWISRNTTGVLRQVIEHPHRFEAYWKIYAAVNEPATEELLEGEVPDYVQDRVPVYWGIKDPETEETHYFYFPLASLDPRADALSGIGDVLKLFNLSDDPKFSFEDTPFPHRNPQTAWEQYLDSSFDLYKLGYEVLTGDDIRTGYPIGGDASRTSPTLFGFEMHPWVKHSIERLIPAANQFNRWNPGYIFGRASEADPRTGEFTPGQPSALNRLSQGRLGADYRLERTTGDRFRVGDVVKNQPLKYLEELLGLAGSDPAYIDKAVNMGYTLDNMRQAIFSARKAIKAANRRLLETEGAAERQRMVDQIDLMTAVYIELNIELQQLVKYMDDNGYKLKDVVRMLRREGRIKENLPNLTDEELEGVYQQSFRDLGMLKSRFSEE